MTDSKENLENKKRRVNTELNREKKRREVSARTENKKEPHVRKQNNTRVRKKSEIVIKSEKAQKEVTTRPQKRTRRSRELKEEVRMKKSPLKIIPLGGLLEIGKNITVFEYENEIIIVDCGLAFPTEDMLGVDLVVADTTYLERNKDKIKGLVVTHGHEDHIGGIPYLLRQVNVPIYATRFTLGLLRNKLDEHRLLKSTKMYEVAQGQTINFGKIKVEFIRTSHSIPDAVSFAIYTPVGTVVHTGDFKIDYTPIDGQTINFGRLAEIGEKGVLLLMSDSTNAERKGFTKSESTIRRSI